MQQALGSSKDISSVLVLVVTSRTFYFFCQYCCSTCFVNSLYKCAYVIAQLIYDYSSVDLNVGLW